jgi:septum formation protein
MADPSRPKLTLASASPRRRELLALLGAPFVVAPNDGEDQDLLPPAAIVEALPHCPLPLRQHPALLAWRKVHTASATFDSGVIIGADTDVVLDGVVLGKPRDPADAEAMLARLAGRDHTVYSGVCVRNEGGALRFVLTRSEVAIAPLSRDEIAAYVATGEPLDKAGAYGIQGLGGRLVQRVAGSYTGVVGLPLEQTHRLLSDAGVAGLSDPVAAYRRWLNEQGKEPLPCPPTLP